MDDFVTVENPTHVTILSHGVHGRQKAWIKFSSDGSGGGSRKHNPGGGDLPLRPLHRDVVLRFLFNESEQDIRFDRVDDLTHLHH